MLGPTLLRASRSRRMRNAVESCRLTRKVATRFVAGETTDDVIAAASALHRSGRATTIDVLGEDVTDLASARQTRDAYVKLLYRLHEAAAAAQSEVSLKLTAVGLQLPRNGEDVALQHAREICTAADAAGCRVTLDMEDHTTVDSTLAIGAELRRAFPLVGNVLQANLRRTVEDLAALASSGARIRLVKGAYREPREVAFQRKSQVDDAYRKGITTLMGSRCYPMIATHDPVMLNEAKAGAELAGRGPADWEVQMLYGICQQTQASIVTSGGRVRVYIPFGTDWYSYFMRRLAERPANVAFFLRALAKRQASPRDALPTRAPSRSDNCGPVAIGSQLYR
jgi:proline dehydrogenase